MARRDIEILERLKAQGHRLTPQRGMVLSAIAGLGGHVGVDQIFQRVREVYPYMDVATVYRTLQLLKRLHLVTEIVTGSGAQYELVRQETDRHHHMVCEQCGTTFDFPASYAESLRGELTRAFGFVAHLDHFTVSGLCAACAGKQGVSTGG
ncbi:MAG: transcriptional repressor [Chloroflexi bacterium]|nr:transcriptional repressor [Chloroflexota bacterium]